MLSLYSFLWSALICSIIILLIYFLRKRTAFFVNFGVWTLMLLFSCAMIRMILPLEIPGFQYTIVDHGLYAWLCEPYVDANSPSRFLSYFGILWIAVALLLLCRFSFQLKRCQKLLRFSSIPDSGKAKNILFSFHFGVKLNVRRLSDIPSPMLTGLFRPTIYLPEQHYTDKELYYILLHEYTHWKNKDLWLKFLINLFCIAFWWNPFVYLLQKNLNQTLEIKCDYIVSKKFSEYEKIEYLQTMLSILRNSAHSPSAYSKRFCTAELVDDSSSNAIQQRFDCLLASPPTAFSRRFYNAVFFLLTFLFMLSSYYFLVQPGWDTPHEELWEDGTTFVADQTNSYLVPQEDGSYLFYFADDLANPEYVSREDFAAGYYDCYPIQKNTP